MKIASYDGEYFVTISPLEADALAWLQPRVERHIDGRFQDLEVATGPDRTTIEEREKLAINLGFIGIIGKGLELDARDTSYVLALVHEFGALGDGLLASDSVVHDLPTAAAGHIALLSELKRTVDNAFGEI